MGSSRKRIVWICDVTGWAYSNNFNRLSTNPEYEYIKVFVNGYSNEKIRAMISLYGADLIVAPNPCLYSVIEDWENSVLILGGNRILGL